MKKNYLIILITLLGIIFFIVLIKKINREVYFELIGDNSTELNIKNKYKDKGFKAMSCNKYLKFFCKNLNKYVSVKTNINTAIKGNYIVKYNLIYKGINKSIKRNVKVLDKESPVITLVDNKREICSNNDYVEEGYKAYDNVDGDITNKVIITKKDNKIYYTVTDSSGNKRVNYRKIKILDGVSPVIELNGGNTQYVYLNNNYIEEGFVAYDNCDGDVSNNVKISSNVDVSTKGTYKVDYKVADTSGNDSIVSKKVIVYSDVSNVPKNGKIIYLTFDDGPCSYTQSILDVLNKYNVKATFFVTHQFSDYDYMIKKEFESGHSIGIHTYSHNYKNIYSSEQNYIDDFNSMNQIIYNETGAYSKLLRFPGGGSNTISKFNKGIMTTLTKKFTNLGYYYFDWNIDSGDTSSKDPEAIFNNVISEIQKRDYSVVLMHDIKKANIESVDKIIKYGLENGYTFLSLNESSPAPHHHINN